MDYTWKNEDNNPRKCILHAIDVLEAVKSNEDGVI